MNIKQSILDFEREGIISHIVPSLEDGTPEYFLMFHMLFPQNEYYKLMSEISKISFSFCMWRVPAKYGYMKKLMEQTDKNTFQEKLSENTYIIYTREYVSISINNKILWIQNMSEYYGRDLSHEFCYILDNHEKRSYIEFQTHDYKFIQKAISMLIIHRNAFMTHMLKIYSPIENEYVGIIHKNTAWKPKTIGDIPLFCKSLNGDIPWKEL